MKALSVPACRSAFLVLPVQLDHVDLLVSPQRKFDHAVEPRRRNFPGLELRAPIGLQASAIPQPLHVPFGNGMRAKTGSGLLRLKMTGIFP